MIGNARLAGNRSDRPDQVLGATVRRTCLGAALVLCVILLTGRYWVGQTETVSSWQLSSRPAQPQDPPPVKRFRGPVAPVLVDGDKLLLAANRRAGTISVADAETRALKTEVPLGKRLSGLVALPDDKWLLATDEEAHELILIQRAGERLEATARLPVPEYPVSIEVGRDGKRCFVASLWSRQLTIVDLKFGAGENASARLALSKSIPLPFAPRKQLLVDRGKRLIVADAFGGKLAVIDLAEVKIETLHELPAHNIRGLALNAEGNRLLLAHQVLNSLARTTIDDVHWGMLMGNVVRSLELNNVLDPSGDVLKGSLAHPLGEAGHAAADPAAIAVVGRDHTPGSVDANHGELAVAMSGVGELGLFSEDKLDFRRVPLGGRPTELVVSRDGRRVYVADELEDSISIVDVKKGERIGHISLPQPELTPAERGERLFYDGRLSHDGWMSCHSCHTDGHSNGLVNDNLGDGSFGAPKRVLSLLGVGRTAPWAWNGEIDQLEAQIKKSVTTTMRGKPPSDEQVQALAAFLRTLTPAPPAQPENFDDDAPGGGDRSERRVSRAERGPPAAAIERGRSIFAARRCDRCHTPPEYTSADVYDVGLKDEAGNTKFNPPSLRGVSQRDRLFHDNRAGSLEEVLSKYEHQIGADLSQQELADLVTFLKSL